MFYYNTQYSYKLSSCLVNPNNYLDCVAMSEFIFPTILINRMPKSISYQTNLVRIKEIITIAIFMIEVSLTVASVVSHIITTTILVGMIMISFHRFLSIDNYSLRLLVGSIFGIHIRDF